MLYRTKMSYYGGAQFISVADVQAPSGRSLFTLIMSLGSILPIMTSPSAKDYTEILRDLT